MWKTLSYEVLGSSHYKAKKVCQDKTYTYNQNGVVAVALADGAGSASHSDVGASIACKSICEYIGQYFDELLTLHAFEVKEKIVGYVLENIIQKAQEMGCEKEALASTLLCVAVKGERIMGFHVGDGIIAYVKNHFLKTLSKPDNGEFANSTYFVTSSRAIEKAKVFAGRKEGITGFALMSDGSCASLYKKKEDMPASALKKLINGLQYTYNSGFFGIVKRLFDDGVSKYTTDDCSIALLCNNEVNENDFTKADRLELCKLFDIGYNAPTTALLERFAILKYTSNGKTLEDISNHINLAKRKTAYRLKHLEKLGMIVRDGELYKSDIC